MTSIDFETAVASETEDGRAVLAFFDHHPPEGEPVAMLRCTHATLFKLIILLCSINVRLNEKQ